MDPSLPVRVSIVGFGRVGKVLCRAFRPPQFVPQELVTRQTAVPPPGWAVRSHLLSLSMQPDLLLLALREEEIIKSVEVLSTEAKGSPVEGLLSGAVVAHTAGSLSAEVLSPLRELGARVMAWHPLQTFTGDEGPEILQGIVVGIDGDPEALELGIKAATAIGGEAMIVDPRQRALYHLGAVFACNFMAALVGESIYLLKQAGVEERAACKALTPLLNQTLRNIFRKGLPDAITGPLRRGDVGTIRRHLEILRSYPRARRIYQVMSQSLQSYLPITSEQEAIAQLWEPDQHAHTNEEDKLAKPDVNDKDPTPLPRS